MGVYFSCVFLRASYLLGMGVCSLGSAVFLLQRFYGSWRSGLLDSYGC